MGQMSSLVTNMSKPKPKSPTSTTPTKRSTRKSSETPKRKRIPVMDSESDGEEIESPIDNKKSRRQSPSPRNYSKGRQIIHNSSSGDDEIAENEMEESKEDEEEKETIVGEKLCEKTDESRNILGALQLPEYLPTKNIGFNWSFWRICSEEIYSTYEKHVVKFDGEYLSRYLLGELFHDKINEDEADYDPSIFFQAVEVVEVHPPFVISKSSRRIRISCREITTSSNAHLAASDKLREITAEDSLVDLLQSCIKKDDLLLVFGDICIEDSPWIDLNCRYQHPVLIVHYRHDGNFGPVSEVNGRFKDILKPCDQKTLAHSIFQYDQKECSIKVWPNILAMTDDTIESDNDTSNNNLPVATSSPTQTHSLNVTTNRENMLSAKATPSKSCMKMNSSGRTLCKSPPNGSDSDASIFRLDITKEIEEKGILDTPRTDPRSEGTRKVKANLMPSEVLAQNGDMSALGKDTEKVRLLTSDNGVKECSVRLKRMKMTVNGTDN